MAENVGDLEKPAFQVPTPLQTPVECGINREMILEEPIAADLKPMRRGGITFYPADSIERIFDWVDSRGRTVEWVEGLFYRLKTDEGQLSLGYICERADENYPDFRAACVRLAVEIEQEAATKGMSAYFELGISDEQS